MRTVSNRRLCPGLLRYQGKADVGSRPLKALEDRTGVAHRKQTATPSVDLVLLAEFRRDHFLRIMFLGIKFRGSMDWHGRPVIRKASRMPAVAPV